MISIIIPTYQHGKTIKDCLDSIYNQTLKDFEIIVINDGSTDGTAHILENYPKPITIIHQENKGSNHARNRGFSQSNGDFILFCDADIVMKKQMLEKMKAALKNSPDNAFAYSSFKWGLKTFKLHPYSIDELKKANFIHTCSLIRREKFLGFDESIKRLQDWDLWLSMMEQGSTGKYIPEILFQIKPRKMGKSEWLPSFVYKLPWDKLGIEINRLKKYKEAEKIIREKHQLS
ncbi:MAG: hypothetical protein COY66_05865 [Candidatus Kerfeldbacteria bacterium CG_4_10_14_0_8_um_filter_42_10]|uniref:Glycosyltransferase 2-like domain-containing protein n=1 Tax=Candidatus Kerfeldbacteria bacterium CG_4_10_14_0_8_um_filter_42_10 TaxID=2014248 RepID=A0A2M7RGE0_9BACT|nr:MAG: hypothetical protein COY66_05865 [Candidatus Kerfeldbacteria bacterium CG_4_10_14_0_8_um_filter_42_10]